MKKILFVLSLWATASSAADRYALLVTNDQGLPGDGALEYTRNDARRMAATLSEVAGFDPANIVTLNEHSAADVLAAIHTLSQRHVGMFLFYYSGHGDAGSLHLSGTRLPLTILVDAVRRVPASLRIGIIDACQSGGATRAKGVKPDEPFDISVAARSEGMVLVSSSAADELSFESDEYKGALFTLHWTAGMRGAADVNHDNQVTLAEAYDYAYAQTLGSTVLSATGAQHATFRWELTGRQDVVLAQLNSSAGLTLKADEDGDYVLFDSRERHVVAEVPVRMGEQRRLVLAPGHYVVKMRGTQTLRMAEVEVVSGDEVLLASQMNPVPMPERIGKFRGGSIEGSLVPPETARPTLALIAQFGRFEDGDTNGNISSISAGIELERNHWLLSSQLFSSTGTVVDASSLLKQVSVTGIELAALYGWTLGRFTLRGGAVLAPLLVSQSWSESAQQQLGRLKQSPPSGTFFEGTFGGRLRLDFEVTDHLMLVGSLDGRAAFVPQATGDATVPAPPTAGIRPWASANIGIRVPF